MGRRLQKILAAISLLIWVAAAVAWPVSYWRAPAVDIYKKDKTRAWLSVNSGRLEYGRDPAITLANRTAGLEWAWEDPWDPFQVATSADSGFRILGFHWSSADLSEAFPSAPSEKMLMVRCGVPVWFVLLLLSWPIIPWITYRRRAALPGNACKQCGYDLRATPGRCPECGAILKG